MFQTHLGLLTLLRSLFTVRFILMRNYAASKLRKRLHQKNKVEEECDKLIAWAKRCKQRDDVSKSVADEKEVYEFVVMLTIERG